MAARSRTRVAEKDESRAEELHALIEHEKDEFISFEDYAKRRGVSL